MDRYTTKRRLLRPLTAWRRHRARDEKPFARAVYEAHDYRPSMRRFFEATRAQPDILIDVDLPDGATVIDVGAFEGEWTTRILERADERGHPELTIHAFEPAPSALKRLRAALRDEARCVVHPFGLGGRGRTEVMTIAGPGTSLFVDPTGPDSLGTSSVEIRDVDEVLTALGVDHIDLIKINIEGGEFELIDRLHETGWLARTDTLIIQFHEFGPDAYRALRRNRRQLRVTHECAWSYQWVYERWNFSPVV